MGDIAIMRNVTCVDICAGTFKNMLCYYLPAHEIIFFRVLRHLLIHRDELESIIYVLFVLILLVPVNIFFSQIGTGLLG